MTKKLLHIGLDVGSTTVKVAVLDENLDLIFNKYQRHYSDIRKTIYDVLSEVLNKYLGYDITVTLTGSGGMLVANWLGTPFVQEVVASTEAVEKIIKAEKELYGEMVARV